MARWKKVVGWGAVAVLSLVLLAIVGTAVLLHSEKFHRYVIVRVQTEASDSLNAQVTLRDFKLNLSTLTLDLYDLNLHSSESDPNAPLLHVDHAGASVKIISMLKRQWNLSDIQVDHPVIHLYVDKNGNNNLPKPKTSNGNSNTNIFDLAIRRAALTNGEIYYNDRRSELDANLLDVTFQSSYDAANGGRYYGSLGYKQGNLHFGDYSPVQHDLSASFDADRNGIKLDPVNFAIGESKVLLHATMQNYTQPVVTAAYDASLDATQFRKILKNASIPVGTVRLAGNAIYHQDPNKPALQTVNVDGTIASRSLLVNQPGLRADIRAIDGHYKIADGNAELSSFRASIFGGEINAIAKVTDLAGAGNGKLHAVAKNISAADLKTLANAAAIKNVNVDGKLNASADATWSGSMRHLQANSDADLAANITNQNNGGAQMPVNAVIHAKYAGDSQTIALKESFVKTPQTTLNLDGTMSKHSNLNIQLHSNDLAEVDTLAPLFSTPKPGESAPPPLGLHGTLSFNGELHGTTADPQLSGQVAGDNLAVKGTSWKQLRTNVALSPSGAALRNGSLVPASKGRITFDVSVGLKKWAYEPSNPINVVLNANQLSLQDVEKAANQNVPATGTLSLNVNVHGSQLNPIGNGTLSLVNAKIQQEPVQSVNVKFNGTGEVVHANLEVRIPAGTTTGTLVYYPKQQGYEATLRTANLQLGQIQTLKAKNLNIAGALNIDVHGKGTVQDPQLQASITIPQLQVQNQQVKGITLNANVANHVGTFNLNSELQNTSVKAQGHVNLTGDYVADASLDTANIPLKPIFAVYLPEQAADMNGETEFHATVRGPLKRTKDLEAHATIPVLKLTYKDLQIGAAQPIKFDYTNHVLTVENSQIKGTDTDLRFGGRIPLNSNEAATLNATGSVNLQLAQMFMPDVKSSGQIKFDINSAGSLADPDVHGKIEIVDADFFPADSPVGLDGGNGVLTLTRDRLQVTSFKGTLGGGDITASGAVIYKPSLQFNLALATSDAHLLYQDSIRVGANSQLALTGNLDDAYLRGQVSLTRLSFTPDFDLISFASSFAGGTASAPSGGFAQNLHLAITVQSTSQLNLVSRGMTIQGNANLRVVGTADNPVILGRAAITGGDLIFNGNRYLLQNSTIEFVNPVQTEPVVNLAASTTISQYNIDLRFHGPVSQLQTTYNSDPALPPVDIINLIARGQTTEAAGQNSNSASVSAQSAIASALSGQVTNRVAKIAGISQLTIDPGLGGGSGSTNSPRIAVQQRVTSNMYVTFATDLTGTQSSQIQVEYRLSPKWSVSGTRDQNGGVGFEAKAKKDF